jgi:hypothetical protein
LELVSELPAGWNKTGEGVYTYTKYVDADVVDGTQVCAKGEIGSFTFKAVGKNGDVATIAFDPNSYAALTVEATGGSATPPAANATNATITITKQVVKVPTVAPKEYTSGKLFADITDTDAYTVAGNEGYVDAGTYTLTLTLKDTDKYCWDNDPDDSGVVTVDFVITQAKNEWKVEPEDTTITYGGAAESPTGKANFGDVVVSYSYTDAEGNVVEVDGVPTNVGTYKATFTVEETKNYEGLTKDVTFTIDPADIDVNVDIIAPTPKTGLVYNSNPQELVNEGRATGGTIVYAVGNDKPGDDDNGSEDVPERTNAGTYKVWYKVVGDDNHNDTEWIEVGDVTIDPATPDYTAPEANNVPYDGEDVPLVNPAVVGDDVAKVEYSTDGENWTTDIPTGGLGDHDVWYKITPKDEDNYETVTGGPIKVTISDPTHYIYVAKEYAFGETEGYSVVYVFAKGNARYGYTFEGTSEGAMYDITALGYQLYLVDGETSLTGTDEQKVDTTDWKVYAIPVAGVGSEDNVTVHGKDFNLAGTIYVTALSPEDVNASNTVDIQDIAAVLTARNVDTNSQYVTTLVGTFFRADVNRNGIIDAAEDVQLIKNAMNNAG